MNYNVGSYNNTIAYNTPFVPGAVASLQAASVDLYVDQGSEFFTDFTLSDSQDQPMDIRGFGAVGSIRRYYGSDETYQMMVNVLDGVAGKIRLQIPSSETIKLRHPRYVYEVALTDGNARYKIFFGQILVSRMA